MNFLNPFFLLGLLAVALPVVIHLINLRRPQKVSFPTLSFFNELKKSTLRRIRIKQYVLLALRAAAVLFLALALARPFLPPTLTGSSGSEAPKAIAIIIDNSASMNRIGAGGPLIEQARQVASTIINDARSSDRFIIATTNGSESTYSLTGASRAQKLAAEIQATNTGNYLSANLRSVYQQLQQAPMKQTVMYLISDGQESQLSDLKSFTTEGISSSRPTSLQLVELEALPQQNIAVAGIRLKSQMLSRESPVVIQTEIKNTSSVEAANQFISLQIDGRMAGQYKASFRPGESKKFLFEVKPDRTGDIPGKIVLEGDEIPFDNNRYFVIHIPQSRSVLLVTEQKQASSEFVSYLTPALEAARLTNTQLHFDHKRMSDVKQAEWGAYDVLILDGLRQVPDYWFTGLQRFVQNGKGVLFFPSEQGDIKNYNDFLGLFNAGRFDGIRGEYASFKSIEKLGTLVEGHPILDGLFDKKEDEKITIGLPDLFYYYKYQPGQNTGFYTILQSASADPILTEQRFGEGKILVSAIGADPGWSNFPVNPLFAPIYYRSILYAASSEEGGMAGHLLGSPLVWNGPLKSRSVELKMGDESVKPQIQALPEGVRLQYPGREWKPGILTIKSGQEDRQIAINQHIMESDFNTLADKELDNMLANFLTVNKVIRTGDLSQRVLQNRLKAAGFGKEIWNWFIWLGLLCLAAETLIARLYKTETQS